MPYTPPAQHSPFSSASPTPAISRIHSTTNVHAASGPASTGTGRPDPPRTPSSASYLSRHRRTPSLPQASKGPASAHPTAADRHVKIQTEPAAERTRTTSGSVRQAPPPVSDAAMPPGAIMSPPDSMQTSSDDEVSPKQMRGRRLDNLAELQAAIRNIGQNRASSPERTAAKLEHEPADEPSSAHQLASRSQATSPLTREARKICHSRSSTENSIVTDLGAKSPASTEDSDQESESPTQRPVMVRKKSGELVKPALRPAAHRRPSSMPGTPTYAKAVHFDAHLEHVRLFLQVDRPVAVSVGTSPVDTYDADADFPFHRHDGEPAPGADLDWEMVASNFPADSAERQALPVRVERIFLSADNQHLVGTVVVANLAFHKSVAVRFTLDYWKTTSEVAADYNHDVRRRAGDGQDRFNFRIKLADQVNLEHKTLFFCVRYNVDGKEFWDNNDAMNFQVTFRKVAPSSSSSSSSSRPWPGRPTRGPTAVRRTRTPAMSNARPWSMPASFDDFSDGFDAKLDYLTFAQSAGRRGDGRPGSMDANTAEKASWLFPDFPSRRTNPASQAFGNRYDFGASLSAAIHAAHPDQRKGSTSKAAPSSAAGSARGRGGPPVSGREVAGPVAGVRSRPTTDAGPPQPLGQPPPPPPPPRSPTTAVPGLPRPETYISEKPSQESSTYLELIDRYCFVRSSPRVAEPT
ncbi:MAG: hypothetical protein M1826_003255 [Phylliscum demangeonii]|nr:MAG: hypothetical protein M1826_003255 [Phylliscum demangeonii]